MPKLKLCYNCLAEIKQPYYAYFSHFGTVKSKLVCLSCSRKLKDAIERCHNCYPYWENKKKTKLDEPSSKGVNYE